MSPRTLVDYLRAVRGLASASLGIGLRFGGRYWRWRMETAMGTGARPGLVSRVRAALAYGLWVDRMRRL